MVFFQKNKYKHSLYHGLYCGWSNEYENRSVKNKMKNSIEVIGLGAGDLEQLPLGMYRKLTQHQGKVYVRTLDHPVVEALQQEGVVFHSFDSLYEEAEQFQTVYENITDVLLQAAITQP